jgi:hypothetical protein
LDRLDLLLLTDSWRDHDFGRYQRHDDQTGAVLFAELGLTGQDAHAVAGQYGVESYLIDTGVRHVAGPTGDLRPEPCLTALFPGRPSLALCNLATVAQDAGFEVCILDNVIRYPFRRKQLVDTLRRDKPRVTGISTTLLLSQAVIEDLVRLIRREAPETRIVLGGPTARRNRRLHALSDFAVFGAGEGPLLSILQALDGKGAFEAIPYIAYRNGSGDLVYSDSN